MAECGELVSEIPEDGPAPEPVFDPSLVQTVDGTCTISPREGAPGEVRTLTVDVENPNAQAASADVNWLLTDVARETRLLATVTLNPIRAEDVATAVATAVPADVDIVPDVFTSGVRAEVDPGSVQEVFVGIAPHDERRARAGSNGDDRPVANGGHDHGALARACSGCAERSRKLTSTNRRIRTRFDIFGRAK